MTSEDVITALGLPAACRVDQRVSKKLLVERGAPTTADRRRINDGVQEMHWVATLKPATVGVPIYRDEMREYMEIAVLVASLRDAADTTRIVGLIHRAIPYPVLLVATHCGVSEVSLASKRLSQGTSSMTVLDGEVITTSAGPGDREPIQTSFLEALSITRQPRTNLYSLYEGWIGAVLALEAAHVTGTFVEAASPERALARRTALQEYDRLASEVARLRSAAAKERQVARQVDLMIQLKLVEQQRLAAMQNL